MDETGTEGGSLLPAQLFPSHPFSVKLLVLWHERRDLWTVSGRRTAAGWGGGGLRAI